MAKHVDKAFKSLWEQKPDGLVMEEDTPEAMMEMGFKQGVAWYIHLMSHILENYGEDSTINFFQEVMDEVTEDTCVEIFDSRIDEHKIKH